ncbi:bile acid:sodium symporter [Serratia ureilytica]
MLFFMHGAKLSREAILAGSNNWRLHLWVMFSTFIIFPALGMLFAWWAPIDVSPRAVRRFHLPVHLPATASAIAFTSLAGGNVAAAVQRLRLQPAGDLRVAAVGRPADERARRYRQPAAGGLIVQLLVPFVAGHLPRPLIGGWIERHRPLIGKTDQTSILLVVYAAFSEAVTHGIWHQVGIGSLAFIVGGSIVLLTIVLVVNTYMALAGVQQKAWTRSPSCACGRSEEPGERWPGVSDVLFPAATVGIAVLPLMVFHQVQLMTCAGCEKVSAQRRTEEAQSPTCRRRKQ